MSNSKARKRKVEEFGGKCARCGYNRSIDALQFHHIDSSEKQQWSVQKGKASLAEVQTYPTRFELLCANCHFEEHARLNQLRRQYRPCLVCSKPVMIRPYRINSNHERFCSKACLYTYRTTHAATSESIAARVMAKVHKTRTCWEWTGSFSGVTPVINITSADGSHAPQSARRVVYETIVGPLRPDQKRLRRICNNPLCVRPHGKHITP